MMFSPYTMYGIGDIVAQGTASQMAMGGTGVAARWSNEINYLNPAALSAMKQNSALFNFGARGNNYYSRTATHKTAYNNFDLSDIGFAVPLARGWGLSFSLQPVSAVGYSSAMVDSTSKITENIGSAIYSYSGDGGISQVAIGTGIAIAKGLSIGANLLYYFGNIDRYYNATIYPLLGESVKYRQTISSDKRHVSHVLYNFGLQYTVRVGKSSGLTIGATYQPRANMRVDRIEETITQYQTSFDTVSFRRYKDPLTIPSQFTAGLNYTNEKLQLNLDYSTQNWKDAFTTPSVDNITLRAQNSYRFGMSYTPDRGNIKSALKRWTYRLGAHYTTSYLMKDDTQLNDFGVSFGADIPLKRNSGSKLALGFDLGRRGTTRVGQVREGYFKIYTAISLFGTDYWFIKTKFD